MSREILTRYRTKVIEDFIMIEGYINSIISKYYLGKVSRKFFGEVLQDEYFNFGLRTNILEKILNESPVIDKPNPLIDDLKQLSRLRNYFAHCNTAFFEGFEDTSKGGIPHPKKTGEYLDFEEIYNKFEEKIKRISEQLIQIMEKFGILFVLDEETKNVSVILE
jgi:hypothetical protein